MRNEKELYIKIICSLHLRQKTRRELRVIRSEEIIQVESRMDTQRLNSPTTANHTDTWRYPLPFYMED